VEGRGEKERRKKEEKRKKKRRSGPNDSMPRYLIQLPSSIHTFRLERSEPQIVEQTHPNPLPIHTTLLNPIPGLFMERTEDESVEQSHAHFLHP
jgi:hypothetical protein